MTDQTHTKQSDTHYPDRIAVVLPEEDLVFIQVVLDRIEGDDAARLRNKLRAAQMDAFVKAHG